MRRVVVGVLIASALLASGSELVQAQSHVYQLNGTYADQMGGPSLVSEGGTLSSTGYSFLANQGLTLSNVFDDGTYSIAFESSLDALSSYRKLLDFKDLTTDNGLYNLSTTLNFYNSATGPSGAYTASTLAFTVFTRDATDNVIGYVNGVAQFSFNDATGLALFTGTNNIARFFEDDSHTGGGEASSGFVDYIATYDDALTADQVAALSKVPPPTVLGTPEPASLALMTTGLLGVGTVARRRGKKKNAATA